ncbi:MAG: cation-transporting P-type ATPase [Candidatus Thermoplasmatota archaeon]|nr:cation-transporting P-type ATPase [Candidatus Thermoplasmatota archaeon]
MPLKGDGLPGRIDMRALHEKSSNDVMLLLRTSPEGLSPDEAGRRLRTNGPNEIPRVKRSFLRKVAPQIFDFVIVLLIGIAAVLALLAWIFPDNGSTSFETSIAIVGVILLSWVLIVFQLYSAERSLEALRKIGAARAKVKRGGKWREVPTKEVVYGDIVMLGEGDRVPADVRIVRGERLTIDESSLTGESVGVEKDSAPVELNDPSLHQLSNMAFMSTIITRGAGEGVVTAVGLDTELGKIAKSIEEAPEPEIPLQKKMGQLARTLSLVMLSLIFILTVVQIVRLSVIGDLDRDSAMEQMVNGIILGVVAVPWSFPIITTSVMARGMMYLVKENAIVRRVASIEGLGRVCVICSDKTGTMTQNAMTVKTLFQGGRFYSVTGSGYAPEGWLELDKKKVHVEKGTHLHRLLEAGFIVNDARLVKDDDGWRVLGDPTEGSLITLASKAGLDEGVRNREVLRDVPFDSSRKMMTRVVRMEDGAIAFCKGGFEVVSTRCDRVVYGNGTVPFDEEMREYIGKANALVNGKAQRTLALAYREIDHHKVSKLKDDEIERNMVLLGFVGMIDPPKEGVREAVSKCHEAGIRVVMITGDSKGTATAIASDLGVLRKGEIVVEGGELPVPGERLKDVSVFCRVSPGQKVDIVNAYRESGQIIAMTGDGMNDAAALKNADVGVAMGISGVDVAKEASQIVLSDDNFATLVTAVHRGRQIFDNIRKSITYQIYTNLSELSLMFMGSLLFIEQMMSDKHLLFLYFSTHLFPVAALVLDRTTPGVMKEPPRDAKEGIVSRKVFGELVVMIFTMTVISLSMFLVLNNGLVDIGIEGDPLLTIQTMVLTFVVWGECFNLFNSLSMKDSLLRQLREKSMLLPVLMTLIPVTALTFFMYFGDIGDGLDLSRLTPLQYGASVLLGLAIVPVVEVYKIYVRWSAGRETRFSRFFHRSMDVSISGFQMLNDMPAYFQRELGSLAPRGKFGFDMTGRGPIRRTGGAIIRSMGKEGVIGKGLSRVGAGVKNAARQAQGRSREKIDDDASDDDRYPD